VSDTYDVIVAGVGAMGSAATYHLARRGVRVLALERFDIPHAMGSSHGHNRIIRLAYFEDPAYVPLLRRAYELWRETEAAAGEQLLYITGGVDAGPEGGRIVQGSLASCREHDLEHELVAARELHRRYPGWQLPADHVAVVQPDAGFVASERAIVAHAVLAMTAGADIRGREAMLAWEPTSAGTVRVTTDRGTYEAGRLILSTGAWIGDHVAALSGRAVPERQVLGWFRPRDPEAFRLGRFPVGIVEGERQAVYVFPEWGIPGFKIGVYGHLHEHGHADELAREPTACGRVAPPGRDPHLLPGRRRRGAVAARVPLHQHRRRALRDRHASRHTAGRRRVAMLRPRVQVLERRRGDPRDLATDRTPPFDLSLFRLARLTAG
jgi:sarcosine oxidase